MQRSGLSLFEKQEKKKAEIAILKQTKQPLSQADITSWLRDLRGHSYIEKSHFAVSCVMEVIADGQYIYAGGVNVENHEHNRLSIHGEQNALIILQSLLGGNVNFSRAWIMAAPEAVQAGSDDPMADNFPLSCGHCRQILLSFTNSQSAVYAVSCNGIVSEPYDLKKLLPEAFSERDLAIESDEACEVKQHGIISLYENNFHFNSSDSTEAIFDTFSKILKPHIINPEFMTSPVLAVIFKLTNGCYIPGVVVQDIAFLTTDAIFAAYCHAIARFGADNIKIEEIHLYCEDAIKNKSSLLTSSELSLLRKFSDIKTPIYHYQAEMGLVNKSDLISVAMQKFEEDFELKMEDRLLIKNH